jgi:putative membrane-bound dehydrogenase-like protein
LVLFAAQDKDLAKELPRIAPREPEDAISTFRIHPDFEIRLVASEPDVASPVAATFDADGRLYVVEMRGYPFREDAKPTGRVRLLEDRDGDGRYERSSVFLDGLNWPTGIVAAKGGVYVAAAPELVFAKDTTGDGCADLHSVVFTGFGTHNVQGLVNGLIYWADGWIYGSSGGNGGTITSPARPELASIALGSRDFRFRPDGSAFEAIPGGGQFGHTMDDWGHRFVCNNSQHIRQVVFPPGMLDRNPNLSVPAVIAEIGVEGGAAPVFRISEPEPWRVVRTRQRAADTETARRLPPNELVATGFFTSASGVTIYRGSAFGPAFEGNAFVGDVGGNLVHRKILEREGVLYRSRRAEQGVEFLASTDNWFRPVNFANTPSGTLFVLDMYRETIEHPDSIPEAIKKHLDLTSGKDRGRIYEIAPKRGFSRRDSPRLTNATTAELVERLGDRDGWWRDTAQRLLVERKDESAIPLLRRVVGSARTSGPGRALALWSLHALERIEPDDLWHAAHEAKGLEWETLAQLSEKNHEVCRLMAIDPDPAIRFQGARTLMDLTRAHLAHAGAGAFQSPEADLRDVVAGAGWDFSDPWVRIAVLSGVAGFGEKLLPRLLESPKLRNSPEAERWLCEITSMIGAEQDAKRMSEAIQSLESWPIEPQRDAAVVALIEGFRAQVGSTRALLQSEELGGVLRNRLDESRRKLQGNGAEESGFAHSVRLVSLLDPTAAADLLPALVSADHSKTIQVAAVEALARIQGDRIADELISRWGELAPDVRGRILDLLLSRVEWATALVEAVETGRIPPQDLDASRRQALLDYVAESVRIKARGVLPPADLSREKVLASYRGVLSLMGDAKRGSKLFVQHCATCHRAQGEGHDVGPALETVAHRAPEDLLFQILDPNREVNPAYIQATVATKDGRILTGIVASETTGQVLLKRADDIVEALPREQIEAFAPGSRSIMPEGLEREVDPQGIADLIVYLKSLSPGTKTGG